MVRVNPLAALNQARYAAPIQMPRAGGVTIMPPVNRRLPARIAAPVAAAAAGGSMADRAYANQQAYQNIALNGAQPEAAGGGGAHGLGWIVGKGLEGAMLPLKVLDYGRAGVASTAAELMDVALPALNEPLGKLPFVEAQPYDKEAIDSSFDIGDIWKNTKARKGFKEQIVEPVMGAKGTDRPGWVKSAVGLAGDIAADPFTYSPAFGVEALAGKPARWTYLNKLLDAQKAAEVAGDTEKVAKLGGMEAIMKMAKRGVGIANPEQAAEMGIEKNALRLYGLAVPGTEKAGRALSNITGLGKEALSGAPGMAALRGIREPIGELGQSLTPNVERLLTGRGAMGAEEALRGLSANDTQRLAGGAWTGIANLGLRKLSRKTKQLGAEQVNELVRKSEMGLERNFLTDYADMVREASAEVGGELPNMKPITHIVNGEKVTSQYTIPHVLSRDFRDHLKAAVARKDPAALDFMERSGITTQDLLEEGGFTQKRWFRPNDDGTPQTFQIGDHTLEVEHGTTDELNRKFAAMFPDFKGKVYETDPTEAWRHYISVTRRDVAIRAMGEEGVAHEFPGFHRDPGTPEPYDPLGGREQMAPTPDLTKKPTWQPPGKVETVDGKPTWVPNPDAEGSQFGRLDVPMRPVERVVRNPEPMPEHEFYQYVPDVNKKGQPGKLTYARNKALGVGEQPRILGEYKTTSHSARQSIAAKIDAVREKLIEPIKERKGQLLEARIEAKSAMGEASTAGKALEKMRVGIDEQIKEANKTIRVAKDRLDKIPAEAEQEIVQRQEAILRESVQARDELLAQRNQLDFQFRESQKHVQRLNAEPDAQLPLEHPLQTGATREQLSGRVEEIDKRIAATLEQLKGTKNREQRAELIRQLDEYKTLREQATRELDAIDNEVGINAATAEGSRADIAQQDLIKELDQMDRRDVFQHTANLKNNEKEVASKIVQVRKRLEANAARKMTKARTALGDDWFVNASQAQRAEAERALRRIKPEAWANYARDFDSMRTLRRDSFELERAQRELRDKAGELQRRLDDPDYEDLTTAQRNKVQDHINGMITRSNEMGQELHRMQGKIVKISHDLRTTPVAKNADTRAAFDEMMRTIDESGEVRALEIQQRSISRRRKEWRLALEDAGWQEQPGGGFVKWSGQRVGKQERLAAEAAANPPYPRIEDPIPGEPPQLPGQLEMRLDEPPPRPVGSGPITEPQATEVLPPKWKRVAGGEYERGPWKIVRGEPGVKNSGWDLVDPNGNTVDHWVKLKDAQEAMQRDLPGVGVPYEPPAWVPPRERPGPPAPRPNKTAFEQPWPKAPREPRQAIIPKRPEFGPMGEQLALPGTTPTEMARETLGGKVARDLEAKRERLLDLTPERIQNEVDKANAVRGELTPAPSHVGRLDDATAALPSRPDKPIGELGRVVGKKPTDPAELKVWQGKVDEWVAKRNAERARIEKWMSANSKEIDRIESARGAVKAVDEAPPIPEPAAPARIEHPKLTEMEQRRADALKGFGSIPERSQRVLAEQMPEIAQTEQKLAAAASQVGAAPAKAKEALMGGARDVFEERAGLGKTIEQEGMKIEGLQATRKEVEQAVGSTRIDYSAALSDFETARKEAETIANKTENMLSPPYAETMVRENKTQAKATKAALERVVKGQGTTYEAQPMRRVVEDLRKIVNANPLGDDPQMLRIEAQLHSLEKALEDLTVNTDIPAHELEKILNEIAKGKAAPVFKAQFKQAYELLYQGGDVIINKELKQAYLRLNEGVTDKGFGRMMRLYTNFFKTYATLSPGFHIRNAMTAIFMNLTEGVPIRMQMRAMGEWGRFAAAENPLEYLRALKATGKTADKATYDAIMSTLASGAGGQFFESGLGELATGTTRLKEGLFANKVTRFSQRKGQDWVEGPVRFALAYDTMMKGGTQIEALHRITRIHFDYSQVSNFDEKAKRYIPFWTFTSRNIPLQFTQMWMKPKIYLRYQSFARNFSVKPPEFMPEYISESGGFDTGLRTPDWLPGAAGGMPIILNPDLPHMRLQQDIKRFAGPLTGENPSQVLSDFNPAFTAPLEYITGQDFFTKQKFGPQDFSPAGPATIPLAMLLAPLGAARKGADGQWYIQDKAMNSLRSLIPPLDRTARLTPGAVGSSANDRLLESWLRFGVGFPGRTLSQSQMESEARRRAYDQRDQAALVAATGG